MKIIEKYKRVIKGNKYLVGTYQKIKFWKDVSFKDLLDFQKLILFKKLYPYTMVGYKRLSNVYDLAKLVEKENKKGVFVECGVWKGGCIASMAFVADKSKSNRKIWLFDSFEGLPEPTLQDGIMAKDYAKNKTEGRLETINQCVGPLEDVKKIFFDILKIKQGNVKIIKGWFQDTLPKTKNEIGLIAILRLDGDWYESTKCCLDNLYDKVISGGYVIIDDYGFWEGSKLALDEFFTKKNIKPNLIKIDYTGVYFKKP